MGGRLHLAKRFFGSLVPFGPAPADTAWAEAQLVPGEVALWRSMPRADRRHAAGVARRVDAALGVEASRPVLAAALLHDVGKTVSGFGTFRRVGATLIAEVRGRREVACWTDKSGWRARVGQYVGHPELGAALLESAGSDPLTVRWAAEHHLPSTDWQLPQRLAAALAAADDD